MTDKLATKRADFLQNLTWINLCREMEELIGADELDPQLQKVLKANSESELREIGQSSDPVLMKNLSRLHLRYDLLRSSIIEASCTRINEICKKLFGTNDTCRIRKQTLVKVLAEQEQETKNLLPLSTIIQWRQVWINVLSSVQTGIQFNLSSDEIYRSLCPDQFVKIISSVQARSAVAIESEPTKLSKPKKAAELLAGLEELSINRTEAQNILKDLRIVVMECLTAHTLSSFNNNTEAVLAAMVEKYNQIEPFIKRLLSARNDPGKLFTIEKKLLQILTSA